ncbi:MAG: peptidoglycan-binding domain-containing protein [Rhodospirillales bacterium]
MSGETYSKSKHPTLRRGARGDAVVKMQNRLVEHLKDLDKDRFSDGDFGPATEHQVKRFQRAQKLTVDGIVGRGTWTALLEESAEKVMSPVGKTAKTEDRRQAADQAGSKNGGGPVAERLMRTLKRKGFDFLDDGRAYHLNIIGVRDPSTNINSFDDQVFLIYRDDNGKQHAVEYSITTDPGEYYTRTELLNKAGAAILVPGQYKDAYQLAKHRGKYEALCQLGGEVTVWRDGNKDDQLDRSGSKYTGNFGINIHRGNAAGRTDRVGKYSAGCQVFQNADDFAVLISLVKKSKALRGNDFTYTLLEKADLG